MDESRFNIFESKVKEIDAILHISSLAQNLLSISKMIDVGMHVVLSSGVCKITRGFLMLDKGVCIGTFYKLDAYTVQCTNASMKSKKRALDSS